MKKWSLLILVCVLVLSLVACKAKAEPQETIALDEPPVASVEPLVEVEPDDPPEDTEEPVTLGEDQMVSPLNGTVISKAAGAMRPLSVMMDNYFEARPQAGLDKADIVYEVLVEGRITRYLAVFQSELPSLIGPIRSARPYFLRWALEYDAYYTHVGGSEQAKSDIKTLKMADIDGMASGASTFWRKNHKPIPNNMYGSGESLLAWAGVKTYKTSYEMTPWIFGETPLEDLGAVPYQHLKIVYKEATSKDSVGYFIEFVYNEESKRYQRSVNGKPHIDEVTEDQLVADSIIIQKVPTKTIDSYGRLALTVNGAGDGYYVTKGQMVAIKWSKANDRARTLYTDMAGNPLVIEPGKVWIQVVESDFQL